MTADLYIHSKASDGKLTIQGIFKEAKNQNINFMAITDHTRRVVRGVCDKK